MILAADARAAGYEDNVRTRREQRVADARRIVTEFAVRLDNAPVAGDQPAKHGGIGIVNLVETLRRAWTNHFVARDNDPYPGRLDHRSLGDAQRGKQAEVLRTQAPAFVQDRCVHLDVLTAAADVLAWRDRA